MLGRHQVAGLGGSYSRTAMARTARAASVYEAAVAEDCADAAAFARMWRECEDELPDECAAWAAGGALVG